MTTKIEQITKELNSKQDFLWCYQDRDAFQVKYFKSSIVIFS